MFYLGMAAELIFTPSSHLKRLIHLMDLPLLQYIMFL